MDSPEIAGGDAGVRALILRAAAGSEVFKEPDAGGIVMKRLSLNARWGGAVVLVVIVAMTLPLAAATSPEVGAVTFRDTQLTGGTGGEPSIAIDKSSTSLLKNSIYVTTTGGPFIWHSTNLGSTWSSAVQFDNGTCGTLVGGDEDVLTLPNGNVVVADLNLSHNVVEVSTDGAATFPTCTATAFESDRPWLGVNGNSLVYIAYHDFVGEVPVVCSSIDGGQTFLLCNHTFGNSQAPQCAENTVPARPMLVDPVDGSLHFMYSCSTAAENAQHPPYGPLHDYYSANSVGPLVMGQPAAYTTATVFMADTNGKAPNYANIFSTMRTDTAGNYYAVFNGTADDNHVLSNPYHVYMTVSTDKGVTWSTPVQVDAEADGKGTHVFADIQPTTPGNVAIVWLGAPATGEPNGICGSTAMTHTCLDGAANVGMAPGGPVPGNWNVYLAQSTNALSASPTFTITPVTSSPVHYGEVCTNGIVCGSSDRSLLDYISVDVDCTGNAHVAYTKNSSTTPGVNGARSIHVADQLTGPRLGTLPSCSPTAVKLSSISAARDHGAVVLRWRTASELGNIGFNVYREVNRHRVKLNTRLIWSSATGTAHGHTYTWRDASPGRHPRYWIQEVLPNGKRVLHGPVGPG